MLKLVIGNKAYSSWSLRGWLAVKQSGLPFEEVVVPLFSEQWQEQRSQGVLAASGGKVPTLVDGEAIVWDSLAILEWLAGKVGWELYWPKDESARALALSMAAEMHSSYPNLRNLYGMNVRRRFPAEEIRAEAAPEIARIIDLWQQARSRFGSAGPYLFGSFGAADIMFAPVVTRFDTYSIPLPPAAAAYRDAMLDHPWMREWITAAHDEPWVIDHYEARAQ
jgi:glutathione S-transferase